MSNDDDKENGSKREKNIKTKDELENAQKELEGAIKELNKLKDSDRPT